MSDAKDFQIRFLANIKTVTDAVNDLLIARVVAKRERGKVDKDIICADLVDQTPPEIECHPLWRDQHAVTAADALAGIPEAYNLKPEPDNDCGMDPWHCSICHKEQPPSEMMVSLENGEYACIECYTEEKEPKGWPFKYDPGPTACDHCKMTISTSDPQFIDIQKKLK